MVELLSMFLDILVDTNLFQLKSEIAHSNMGNTKEAIEANWRLNSGNKKANKS